MMHSKLFLAGLFGLALLGAPSVLADSVADTPDAAVRATYDKVGDAVTAIPLLNDARPSTTARYYIYLCTASWCPPSRQAMQSAVAEYGAMKKTCLVEVLHISYDNSEDDTRKYINELGVQFPSTMSRNASVLPGFGHPGYIPSYVIVDAHGNVVKSAHGSTIGEWKSHITTYEKEKGLPLSFPETLTLTYTPRVVLADVEMKKADAESDEQEEPGKMPRKPSSKVGKVLAELSWVTENEPNLRAKNYIYLCSASWCGPCNAEMPHVAAAYKDMKKDDTELILVSFDHSPEAARAFLEKYGAEFPIIMQGDAAGLPGIRKPNGIPFCCIVDASGKLYYAGHGSAAAEWYKHTGGKKPRAKKDKKDKKDKKSRGKRSGGKD